MKQTRTTASFKKLNRFTTLPFVIDLLQRKKLSLINPAFWEDYNDRATIEIFREKSKATSIYALCLTHQSETIHHWNAFANGTSGCCVEFSPGKLFETLNQVQDLNHGEVKYIRMNELSEYKGDLKELPFLKRHPFKNENEYRIISVSSKPQAPAMDIDISLDVIRRITISNKVPAPVFESIKSSLAEIASGIKVYHSTLYNNSVWVNHFKK